MSYTNCGFNKETDRVFMEPIPTTIEDKEKLKKQAELYLTINMYTKYRDKFLFPQWFKQELSKNITYDKKTNTNTYEDEEFSFKFELLSDSIESRRTKRILKSDKRYHKCHEASFGMALNDDEDETYILTGYVPTIDEEVLHSVLEVKKDESKSYIVDFTQNIIMDKNDFIDINCFRVISRISCADLKSDLEVMRNLNLRLPFYFAFRDEIMRDLKKNSKVLGLKD